VCVRERDRDKRDLKTLTMRHIISLSVCVCERERERDRDKKDLKTLTTRHIISLSLCV